MNYESHDMNCLISNKMNGWQKISKARIASIELSRCNLVIRWCGQKGGENFASNKSTEKSLRPFELVVEAVGESHNGSVLGYSPVVSNSAKMPRWVGELFLFLGLHPRRSCHWNCQAIDWRAVLFFNLFNRWVINCLVNCGLHGGM